VLSIFKIGSHELFAHGWLRTVILLISASLVARIAGMSHIILRAVPKQKSQIKKWAYILIKAVDLDALSETT
jgi:hypothetical protein